MLTYMTQPSIARRPKTKSSRRRFFGATAGFNETYNTLTRSIVGNRRPSSSTNPCVQTKLKVSSPGDHHEKEADRVAEQVVTQNQSVPSETITPYRSSNVQAMCEECDEELQRKANDGSAPSTPQSTNARVNTLNNGGQQLPSTERQFFERRMNVDFSQVRIHTDSRADQLSHDLNARAFTHRNNIAFANGEYQPNTPAGRHLLGHELTHVVQQSRGVSNVISRKECTPRDAGQCCRDAKSAGKDKGDIGGVVCCDGRKVACNWYWLADGHPNDFIERIIERCVTDHELTHFDDIDDCAETCPSLDRPDYSAGKDANEEECKAHKVGLECLQRHMGECDTLTEESHRIHCKTTLTDLADGAKRLLEHHCNK